MGEAIQLASDELTRDRSALSPANANRQVYLLLKMVLLCIFEWKKIHSEDEKDAISLETMIRGTCEKSRLLDIVENFTLFLTVSRFLELILSPPQH